MERTKIPDVELELIAQRLMKLDRDALLKRLVQYAQTNWELTKELDNRAQQIIDLERVLADQQKDVDKLILTRLTALNL